MQFVYVVTKREIKTKTVSVHAVHNNEVAALKDLELHRRMTPRSEPVIFQVKRCHLQCQQNFRR